MKRNALSSKEVAGAKVGEHLDGAGLSLVVSLASKSWVQRYSVGGKRNSFTIGKYPAMSLSEANFHKSESQKVAKKNAIFLNRILPPIDG